MKKKLKHISHVTGDQIAFGIKLGIDLKNCSETLAFARIEDAIDKDFFSIADYGKPTQKQINLARQFGYDISEMSRREGNAIIDDLMTELNLETIESEKLSPGVEVINVYDVFAKHYIISSISPDGTVYFRGGNGRKAWARNLKSL